MFRKRRPPKIYYIGRQGWAANYWTALKRNTLINMPFPWRIKIVHGLAEHQKRMTYARKFSKKAEDPLFHKSLDDVYEALVHRKKERKRGKKNS